MRAILLLDGNGFVVFAINSFKNTYQGLVVELAGRSRNHEVFHIDSRVHKSQSDGIDDRALLA